MAQLLLGLADIAGGFSLVGPGFGAQVAELECSLGHAGGLSGFVESVSQRASSQWQVGLVDHQVDAYQLVNGVVSRLSRIDPVDDHRELACDLDPQLVGRLALAHVKEVRPARLTCAG